MINQPIQIFKLMYLSLSSIWKHDQDTLFGLYLSEADPFVTGDDSADPVIYEDFLASFKQYGTYDDYGYDFIIKYLSNLDPYYGDLLSRFLTISKQQFIQESKENVLLTDEEIVAKFGWNNYYKDK